MLQLSDARRTNGFMLYPIGNNEIVVTTYLEGTAFEDWKKIHSTIPSDTGLYNILVSDLEYLKNAVESGALSREEDSKDSQVILLSRGCNILREEEGTYCMTKKFHAIMDEVSRLRALDLRRCS